MISEICLIFVVVGWLIQFLCSDSKKISITFVCFYLFGILLLVIDGVLNNLVNLAILNFICFVIGLSVLIKIARSKKH